MTRTLTILAAATAALAVSAAAASAGTPQRNVNDGTSNTVQFGEFTASKKPTTRSLAYVLQTTMISGYARKAPGARPEDARAGIVAKPAQPIVLYDGHAGLGANTTAAR